VTSNKLQEIKIIYISILVILVYLNFMPAADAQEFNIVLAVDTSGSASYNDFYWNAILNGIPKFSNYIKETYPKDVRVGLLSWDEDIDFIIKPTDNFSLILESSKDLSSGVTESTDLNQPLYGAEDAFDEPAKYIWSKNILIIILEASGEYKKLSVTPNIGKYKTYYILLDSKNNQLFNELKNLSPISGGQFYALASSASALEEVLEHITDKEMTTYISKKEMMHVNLSNLKNDIISKNNR
jgi:hypothetical protein